MSSNGSEHRGGSSAWYQTRRDGIGAASSEIAIDGEKRQAAGASGGANGYSSGVLSACMALQLVTTVVCGRGASCCAAA